MVWYGVGIYCIVDGCGGVGCGQQCFVFLNFWFDNVSFDKVCCLLWLVKQKYGQKIFWVDFYMLVGNVVLENVGFCIFGFGVGCEDVWELDFDVDWGDEKEWLVYCYLESLVKQVIGVIEMGLIYVNLEGLNVSGELLFVVVVICVIFGNMVMDDEEIVVLIVGGYMLGKIYGVVEISYVGVELEVVLLEVQGLGWYFSYGSGVGVDVIIFGLEVVWMQMFIQWSNYFFENLFKYEWVQICSLVGVIQFEVKDVLEIILDLFNLEKKCKLIMLVIDLILCFDLEFEKIFCCFFNDLQVFNEVFVWVWFKLIYCDMGLKFCYFGLEVLKEDLIWQDLLLVVIYQLSVEDIVSLKSVIVGVGLLVSELVLVVWVFVFIFCGGDKCGGVNGVCLVLVLQIDWLVNVIVSWVLLILQVIQCVFGKVLLVDIIVLVGVVGVEQVVVVVGVSVNVLFISGCVDVLFEQIDVELFDLLQLLVDGFCNYCCIEGGVLMEILLIDKVQQLMLIVLEMIVLVGGLCVLGVNYDGSKYGVFIDCVGVFSNDFFVNLFDMVIVWKVVDDNVELFIGSDCKIGEVKYSVICVDLVFGFNLVLCVLVEVYVCVDGQQKLVYDFVVVWIKVMNFDCFDL